MSDECDTRRKKLRAGRLDEDLFTEVGRGGKANAVVGAGALAVLEFSLCHGGAEGDIPQSRCFRLVGLAASQVAQERQLADALGARVDRLVRLAPVNREPELAPQVLEDHFVLDRELLAQFDEVAARDRELTLGVGLGRGSEIRVVWQRRIAANSEVVLHPTLGR